MNTQFVRSRNDKMIAGVCGGIARYFNIDPVIVRLIFVLSVFLGGVATWQHQAAQCCQREFCD